MTNYFKRQRDVAFIYILIKNRLSPIVILHYSPNGKPLMYQRTNKAVHANRMTKEYLQVYFSSEP